MAARVPNAAGADPVRAVQSFRKIPVLTPRTSTAALSVVSHQPTVKRLKPPDSLSKAEAALFNEIVGSMPPDYFNHTDRLLLVRYVEAHAQAELAKRHLAKEGMVTKTGKPSPWITVQEKPVAPWSHYRSDCDCHRDRD